MKANEIVIGTTADNNAYIRLYNDETGYTMLQKALTHSEIAEIIHKLQVTKEFMEYNEELEKTMSEEALASEFDSPELYEDFKAAAELARTMPENHTRRARRNGRATNYWGGNFEGQPYVSGSTDDDIKKPDLWINSFPAKRV